jgi:hypothetical protein
MRGHGVDQVRGHVPQVGNDRAETEGDLAWPVSGAQQAAIHKIIERSHAHAEPR